MILCVCPNPSIDTYAWIPRLVPGEANRISRTKAYAGGKAIHVALALKELGAVCKVLGIWAGSKGDWIRNELQRRGIESTGIFLQEENRSCYTFRSDDPNTTNTELLTPGPHLKLSDWKAFLKIYTEEIQTVEYVNISGSLPDGAPEDGYLQLAKLANYYKKHLIADASGLQLKNLTTTSFFGLHINQHEAYELSNSESLNNITSLLSEKVKLIALTLGKEGLYLYKDQKIIHANVSISEVKSTVGSGDCLTAGLLYALSLECSDSDIARYAVACGAANCLHEDLGLLLQKDVMQLLPQVTLKTTYETA
ncbi:1-phosphofructokinase family hexose kinase [Salegentibacter sp. HM20]